MSGISDVDLAQAFDDIVRRRRSVRGFRPDPVSPELIEAVFGLAQLAPSNCNTQPWKAVVVRGERCVALRQRLQDDLAAGRQQPDFPYSGKYAGVYRDRQYDAAFQLYGAMGIAREDRAARAASFMRNFDFFDAPQVAFLFLPEWGGVREAADLGMWAQTLLLAMTAHGLASCPQTSLSFNADLVRDFCGVAEEWKLLFGVSFGYEDVSVAANRCRVGRAPLDEVLTVLD